MALFIASENWDSILSTSTPTIYIAGVNDTLMSYDNIQNSYGQLLSMDIPTQLISSTPRASFTLNASGASKDYLR